jgi:hypothetical protein
MVGFDRFLFEAQALQQSARAAIFFRGSRPHPVTTKGAKGINPKFAHDVRGGEPSRVYCRGAQFYGPEIAPPIRKHHAAHQRAFLIDDAQPAGKARKGRALNRHETRHEVRHRAVVAVKHAHQ